MAIRWAQVSEAIRAALAEQLANGGKAENVRLVPASATILTELPTSDEVRLAGELETLETAGGPSMITDGKPTIMRVVAWMAHEGINKNRLAFTAEDLRQAAAKIKEPDFLPMDFNHSAVRDYGGEQKAIGVWYKSEFAQDPAADNAWGILLTGIMWSWMNPQLADTLLAEQSRNGRIDFSMACIPASITYARNEDGPYEIAHDTTFFTLSALDVPPADPKAVGYGVEGSTDPNVEAELRERLLQVPATAARHNPELTDHPEDVPMDELLAQLKELSTATAKIADANVKEQIEALLDAKLAELKSLVAENTAADEDTAAKLTEAQTKADALETALATANAEIKRLTEALTEATAKLDAIAAKEAEAAAQAALATRIESLPEAYREAHAKRSDDERSKVEARWMKMSDEEFEAFKADLAVVATASRTASYLARSAKEGRLPEGGAAEGSARKRLSQFLQ